MPLPQGAILDSIIFATCAWCGSGSLNLADVSTSNSQFKIVIEGKILINQFVEISYPD
jgi:hypothetical protein